MSASQGKQLLRIIGGNWRGRKLKFHEVKDLRPTPDRVRETLFNWLMYRTEGAVCLDLFAGSGALGLEALSRGAKHVVFVEKDDKAIKALDANLTLLGADNYTLKKMDSLEFVKNNTLSFDIVFIDPPYQSGLYADCAILLEDSAVLVDDAMLYIEHSGDLDGSALPANWQQRKVKTAGQVHYELYQRSAPNQDPV